MTPEAVLLRVFVLLPFPCFAGAFAGGPVVWVTQLAFVAGVDLVQQGLIFGPGVLIVGRGTWSRSCARTSSIFGAA
jgi:hypothetical protein